MLSLRSILALVFVSIVSLGLYNWPMVQNLLISHKPLPGLELVKITPGKYNLTTLVPNSFGRQYYSKPVEIKHPFQISRYEITIDQWNLCFKEGGCAHKAKQRRFEKGDFPVTYVTWFDTMDFTKWLSKRTGQNFRLPTEEEWSYAAFTGKDVTKEMIEKMIAERQERAFTSAKKFRRTKKIGTFGKNKWGIYDTRGAVWNWTMTCRFPSDEANIRSISIDKLKNPDLCSNRVVQGDERGHVPVFVGEVLSGGCGTGEPIDHIGFRVVRDLTS